MQRGVLAVCIVRENVIHGVAILADGYNLQTHILEYQTLLIILAEEHLLAVTQRDGILRTSSLVASKCSVSLVVEDNAINQRLYNRHSLMLGCCNQTILRQHNLGIDSAGKERTLGADNEFARCKGLLDGAVG